LIELKGKFKSGRLTYDGITPVKVYDNTITDELLDINIWRDYYRKTFTGSYDWNIECDELGVKNVSFKLHDYVIFYERIETYKLDTSDFKPFKDFLNGLRDKVQVSSENAKERLLSMLDYIISEWEKGKYL
jgi:hypothetical protein